ncbi:MAG: SDR family oxidoreductase [Longispora sp.]|nr:SDR family oxidoreductase [Longispora sp. (in: high G+C Gram-positive bacteria)]
MRRVLVTGGDGGIGKAVCAAFAATGDDVRSADLPDLDVRDSRAVTALIANFRPNVLVTLAGGSLGTHRDDYTDTDLDLVLDVNVKGTLYCVREAGRHMGRGDSIITCSSIGGRQPSPVTGAPYAAAKAAIGGLTRKFAKDLGPRGIRVNAVAPGLFLTGRLQVMFDGLDEGERRDVLAAIPLGRMPEMREIVDPILFLASDAASYITGVTLDVNGGRYLAL